MRKSKESYDPEIYKREFGQKETDPERLRERNEFVQMLQDEITEGIVQDMKKLADAARESGNTSFTAFVPGSVAAASWQNHLIESLTIQPHWKSCKVVSSGHLQELIMEFEL